MKMPSRKKIENKHLRRERPEYPETLPGKRSDGAIITRGFSGPKRQNKYTGQEDTRRQERIAALA